MQIHVHIVFARVSMGQLLCFSSGYGSGVDALGGCFCRKHLLSSAHLWPQTSTGGLWKSPSSMPMKAQSVSGAARGFEALDIPGQLSCPRMSQDVPGQHSSMSCESWAKLRPQFQLIWPQGTVGFGRPWPWMPWDIRAGWNQMRLVSSRPIQLLWTSHHKHYRFLGWKIMKGHERSWKMMKGLWLVHDDTNSNPTSTDVYGSLWIFLGCSAFSAGLGPN